MNDCQNAKIRDQLPDLLHDRLGADERAAVLAHVESCADCREELELLRAARAMLQAQAPRVDVNWVVNALPAATQRAVTVQRRRPVWADWRIAAAVTLLVAGGGSFAVLRQRQAPLATSSAAVNTAQVGVPAHADSVAVVKSPTVAPTPSERTVPSRENVVASEAGLGSGRLGDLTERQLAKLLEEMDQLQATPITDPEPVSLRVGGDDGSTGLEGA
ncbi:MAG TPA: zf-HC2 domain-containing protein [Gemmatimonadaceae bacterium]|nr:zf-HC2 domain-containing protein [Gemmatimonadaceae bacterium]